MAERIRTISEGDNELDLKYDIFNTSAHSEYSLMNTSQISTTSTDSTQNKGLTKAHSISKGKGISVTNCRFPKLEECAHFHYERVQLGKISIRLIDDKPESIISSNSTTNADGSSLQQQQSFSQQHWFIMKVSAGRSDPFLIKRSLQNLKLLDEILHRCVYDRRISELENLNEISDNIDDEELEDIVSIYLARLSTISSDAITCGQCLTWLQLDNKGRRLPVADQDTMLTINTPAIGAAYGVKRYVAQACDEISIEVGDMISVIDMPSPAESVWWRGKKSLLQKNQYEVGFFPQSCVATIGEKVPRNMPLPAPLVGSLDISPTKPVLRKHGKLITFFRSFILSRPSRRRLKQSGIYKERVFSCDLSEHLLNSGQDIPMVLKCCAEFIEQYGIVDGIYRLSGITSNIQKLRRAFDEERIPDLSQPDIKQDIHAVSSLLKMYFRELPNPLCTYQLYDHFVDAIQARTDTEDLRLKMIKQTVRKLPPPHYRTLKYLACHLCKISKHSASTGMTERNIAIVWAPNLLRSPALESGGVAALRGVGVQAVVTEYLISNCDAIFDDANDDFTGCYDSQPNSLSDTSSLHMETRELSLSMIERPKSLGIGPPKLISLEEAQIRKNRRDIDINKAIPITSTHNAHGSYIEVGGGPSSLPDKYHTVLPVPRSWNKRKTTSWKSIFQRGLRQSNSNQNLKGLNAKTPPAPSIESKTIVEECPSTITNKELPSIASTSNSQSGSLKENKLAKSADVLDTNKSAAVEIPCPRSTSIDSLRTTGHSRSVSHDSYFDFLQSPLRGMTTCPSRELSELGINFDREEPEMRIFSESESLVSSPKVAKETTRRVLRARPEEYSSAANSVNPSPKKQPRLNLQSPPEMKTWASIVNENNANSSDESSCKRYKLEDQLSDIQFIDSNTPEHTVNNIPTNTGYAIYTSIQIPGNFDARDHKVVIDTEKVQLRHSEPERYSYPVSTYGYVKNTSEERFSYPITISHRDQLRETPTNIYQMKITSDKKANTIDGTGNPENMGFYIEYGKNIDDFRVPRSSSANAADVSKKSNNEMNKSKLSIVTPQSPVKSPCYSLLIGSTTTNSSNSSTNATTPVFDMDVCTTTHYYEPINFHTKDDHHMKDLKSKKNDLCLELNQKIQSNRNIINVASSPNTPNCHNTVSDTATTTNTNTSQSLTPSEIGYQNLFNRQSPEHEEAVKPTIVSISNYIKPSSPIKSPLKSTINITYNLKSPTNKNSNDQNFFAADFDDEIEKKEPKGLLETSFDETMVYEQVKFCKNRVSEVNDLVDEPEKEEEEQEVQIVPEIEDDDEPQDQQQRDDNYENVMVTSLAVEHDENEEADDVDEDEDDDEDNGEIGVDVCMMEQNEKYKLNECDDNPDSLEYDQNLSLYENVELRRPPKVYENMHIAASLNSSPIRIPKAKLKSKYSNDDLEKDMEFKVDALSGSLKPSNFMVKKLATKFETSPVDNNSPFDFPTNKSTPFNRRSETGMRGARRSPEQSMETAYNITRSLDENAFIREFGSAKKFEEFTKSIKQVAAQNPDRRKSVDCSPKTLSPVKKSDGNSMGKLVLNLTDNLDGGEGESRSYSVRITPTTENRISLIQHNNFELSKQTDDVEDDKEKSTSTTSLTSLKMLGSCKLDRERIEKIKEERRLQLNEKYRSESFRNLNNNNKLSRPKTNFEENVDISRSRFKSKSKHELLSNIENEPYSLITATSASTHSLTLTTGRTRRISDEKNQNDVIDLENVVLRSNKNAENSDIRDMKTDMRQRSLKYEKKNFEFNRERNSAGNSFKYSQSSSQHDRCSPQISIKDVAAMFESRSQQQ